MVSKRQKLARKRFKESHPELFPKPQPPAKDPIDKPKSKIKKKKRKPRSGEDKNKSLKRKSKTFKKHPLRLPGMKPGESCFICKAQDHIAKLCTKKSAWEKNKICLLCRQCGHSFKNCSNKSDGNQKKYCYNCGEAGHTLSKCPQPLKDGGANFANCFVCNESGHLSKNCPQNTHGIYPKGGSCKICGGVTHLAKHCPNKSSGHSSAFCKLENCATAGEHGENRKGKVTKFSSGDDLDDDFVMEDDQKVNASLLRTNTVSLGVQAEKNIHVKPKNKQGPKVVNFLG